MDVEAYIAEQQARFDATMAAVRQFAPTVPENKAAALKVKTDHIANQYANMQGTAESIAKLLVPTPAPTEPQDNPPPPPTP